MTPLSCIRPPKKRASPMPVVSFGDRKNGWLKSSGRSSSQILSSFCQNVNSPSIRFASLITSANGRSAPGAAADRRGAGRHARPEAAPPGPTAPVGAAAPPAGAGAQRAGDEGLQGGAAAERGEPARTRPEAGRTEAGRADHAEASAGRSGNGAFDGTAEEWFSELAECPSIPGRRAPRVSDYISALKRRRCGRAPSSPRRFFLSASYSW